MNITSFLFYCFIVTFTPGPTNIVILSTVNHFGSKQAMKYTYGATIAFGLLLFLSAWVNTTLITVLPRILVFMQVLSSLYMIYLAYQIYKMDTSQLAISQTYLAVAACGFVDLAHLNKQFKNVYGVTAFEYMAHLN